MCAISNNFSALTLTITLVRVKLGACVLTPLLEFIFWSRTTSHLSPTPDALMLWTHGHEHVGQEWLFVLSVCVSRCDVWSRAVLHTGAQRHHRRTGAAPHAPLPGERHAPTYHTVEAQQPAFDSGSTSHHLHQRLPPDWSLPEDPIRQLVRRGRLRVRGPEFLWAGGEPQGPHSGSQ